MYLEVRHGDTLTFTKLKAMVSVTRTLNLIIDWPCTLFLPTSGNCEPFHNFFLNLCTPYMLMVILFQGKLKLRKMPQGKKKMKVQIPGRKSAKHTHQKKASGVKKRGEWIASGGVIGWRDPHRIYPECKPQVLFFDYFLLSIFDLPFFSPSLPSPTGQGPQRTM